MKFRIDRYNKDIETAVATLTPIFNMHGWTWHNDKYPPSAEQIKDAIYERVDNVLKGSISSSSGRIKVTKCNDGEQDYLNISLDLCDIYSD